MSSAPISARPGLLEPGASGDHEQRFSPIEWDTARRLFSYTFRSRRLQTLVIVQAIAIAALNAAVPIVMTETIRWTIENPARFESATGLSAQTGLVFGAGGVALLAIAYLLLMGWRILTVHRLTERAVFAMRHDLLSHILTLDMAYFDRTKLGRILSRGTGDIDAMRSAISQVIPRTIIHVLLMAFMALMMLMTDWFLSLLLLGIAPLVIALNRIFRLRMQRAYLRVRDSFSRITSNIAESVAGIRVTQGFARERVNAEAFGDLLEQHRRNNLRAAAVHGMYIPLFDLSSQVVAVIILVVGGWRLTHGAMDVADLIGFLLYSGAFFGAALVMADLYNTTLRAMAGGHRFFDLLDRRPTITDGPEARELGSMATDVNPGLQVELRNVTFGYDPQRPVLHDVSMTCASGQVVALVGHTGGGKSSIVNLVARLYEPQHGQVLVDGVDVRTVTLRSLRRQMAMVSQSNFLFDGTIRQNIGLGDPAASDDQVIAACRGLDCLDVFNALPDGLETSVGERGNNLSLGQRQLVCFARAMLANPRLLILDEATSSVDTFTEHRIQQALDRLMRGRSTIVVAHRLSTIRHADLILVIDKGRVAERGRHDQLLSAGGLYAELHEQFLRLIEGD